MIMRRDRETASSFCWFEKIQEGQLMPSDNNV
jgi:hypothetical protein